MPTHLPPILVPYLQSCLEDSSAVLITSVVDSPTYWVTLRLVKAAALGTDDDSGSGPPALETGSSTRHELPVIFLSFLRPFDYWVELGKKIGLDLAVLANKKQFAYVDGLTTGLIPPESTTKVSRPRSHSLQDISHAILSARSMLLETAAPSGQGTLVIDGLDYVLASQTDIGVTQLSNFVTDARATFSVVALTISADSPLLHNVEASATPLELDHSVFLRNAAHQSKRVIQLRPLETGYANDVSGVVRISRGGAERDDNTPMPDGGEWLYQVKGDGSVKVWNRGE